MYGGASRFDELIAPFATVLVPPGVPTVRIDRLMCIHDTQRIRYAGFQ